MRDAQILTLPFQVPFDAKYNLRIYIFTSRFTKAKIPGIKFHSPQSVKYILVMPKTTIRTSVNASEFHRIMGYCFWSGKRLFCFDLKEITRSCSYRNYEPPMQLQPILDIFYPLLLKSL